MARVAIDLNPQSLLEKFPKADMEVTTTRDAWEFVTQTFVYQEDTTFLPHYLLPQLIHLSSTYGYTKLYDKCLEEVQKVSDPVLLLSIYYEDVTKDRGILGRCLRLLTLEDLRTNKYVFTKKNPVIVALQALAKATGSIYLGQRRLLGEGKFIDVLGTDNLFDLESIELDVMGGQDEEELEIPLVMESTDAVFRVEYQEEDEKLRQGTLVLANETGTLFVQEVVFKREFKVNFQKNKYKYRVLVINKTNENI